MIIAISCGGRGFTLLNDARRARKCGLELRKIALQGLEEVLKRNQGVSFNG